MTPLEKLARHAHDRLTERTNLHRRVVDIVEREANLPHVPRIEGFITLRDWDGSTAGFAAVSPIDGRLVVKTILGPKMVPKGVPLDWHVRRGPGGKEKAAAQVEKSSSALRSRVSVVPFRHSEAFPHGFTLRLGGLDIGSAALKGGKAQIQGIEIDPKYRGLGLGKKFYGELMRRMPGQTLASDFGVSRDATAAWRSLGKNPSIVVRERLPGELGPKFVGSLPEQAAVDTVPGLLPTARPAPHTADEIAKLDPIRKADRERLLYGLGGPPVKVAKVVTPLQPHQQRVVERIQREDQPGLVVVHKPGSGKSLASIASQEALGLPADVVVPASLQANYRKELSKHVEGGHPEAEIQSLQNLATKRAVPRRGMLIVDEAHRIRDPASKSYQTLRKNLAKKRLLLTGTPFYNHPADIAPLVNVASGSDVLPADRDEFESRYVSEIPLDPGLLARIRGVKPGTLKRLNKGRKDELRQAFGKWVDYHPGSTEGFPSVEHQNVPVEMSPEQTRMYDAVMGKAPYWVRAKVKAGLPPTKSESKQLNAFLGAVRQISNTTAGFQTEGQSQEPKIQRAFEELSRVLGSDEKAKAVVYSNFLESGINPYRKRLEEAKIPFGEFTGEMPRSRRDALVREYNEGKLRALLLSSAGGEGLDLKGTRLVQMLDPHWNEPKLEQVKARAIRYGSHADLPEDQRKVLVQQYLSTRPRSGVLEKLRLRDPGKGVDEYLLNLAEEKARLNAEFEGLLPGAVAG